MDLALLFGSLGLTQVAKDLLSSQLPPDALGDCFVKGTGHAVEF